MTKKELFEYLKPFTDDIKIKVTNHDGIIVDSSPKYLLLVDGEGIVLLAAGLK